MSKEREGVKINPKDLYFLYKKRRPLGGTASRVGTRLLSSLGSKILLGDERETTVRGLREVDHEEKRPCGDT